MRRHESTSRSWCALCAGLPLVACASPSPVAVAVVPGVPYVDRACLAGSDGPCPNAHEVAPDDLYVPLDICGQIAVLEVRGDGRLETVRIPDDTGVQPVECCFPALLQDTNDTDVCWLDY